MSNPKAFILSNNLEVARKIGDSLLKRGVNIDFLLKKEDLGEDFSLENKLKKNDYLIVIDIIPFKKVKGLKFGILSNAFLEKTLELVSQKSLRLLFILPYFQTEKDVDNFKILKNIIYQKGDKRILIAFVGELFEAERLVSQKGIISDILRNFPTENIKINKKKEYQIPIELNTFSQKIIDYFFSLSTKRVVAFLSSPISHLKFVGLLEKASLSQCVCFIEKGEDFYSHPSEVEEIIFINSNLSHLNILLKSYANISKETRYKLADFYWVRNFLKKNNVFLFFLSLLFILTLPLFLFFLSFSLFFLSRELNQAGFLQASLNFERGVEVVNSASLKYTSFFSNLFQRQPPYVCLEKALLLNNFNSKALSYTLKIKKDFLMAYSNLFGENGSFDDRFFNQTAIEVGNLADLINDYEAQKGGVCWGFLEERFVTPNLLSREKLIEQKKIVENLSLILGFERKKTYALLIQDDSILRPGGGLINKVILIDLYKGKIEKALLYDVSSIDRFIRGRVESPVEVKNLLGVQRWYLRDSNWHSDFRANAKQALSFINEGLGVEVDGVLAVNLSAVFEFFEKVGKFEKAKFSQNLGLLKSDKVSASDYPSFAEEGGVDVLERIKTFLKSKDHKRVQLLDLFYQALEEKDIQIFLINELLNKEILNVGWGGDFSAFDCTLANCYKDSLKIILAESEIVGSEKIERDASLEVFIGEGFVRRELEYRLNNKDDKRAYRFYIRIVVPEDSGVGMLEIRGKDYQVRERLDVSGYSERKEGSKIITIDPDQELTLIFLWESSFGPSLINKGEYILDVFKQSGAKDLPLKVFVKFSGADLDYEFENFSLTQTNTFGYNVALTRDINSRIFWKNGNYFESN